MIITQQASSEGERQKATREGNEVIRSRVKGSGRMDFARADCEASWTVDGTHFYGLNGPLIVRQKAMPEGLLCLVTGRGGVLP